MQRFKISWFKIYICLIIATSVALLGFNLWAATVGTGDLIIRQYIKGQNCPQFGPDTPATADMNALTMKDTCTGLVWVRHELSTYHGASQPGYTWDEAATGCANLEPKGMFRLPSTDELLSLVKYQCSGSTCGATLGTPEADGKPFFSNGTYWSRNDFNEPANWTDLNRIPPGNPQRDYKRSVNLLNGKVDSPVYNKLMKLNAWCLVDKTPEIIEKKFTNVTLAGNRITGGNLEIVYNRKCTTNINNIECAALANSTCANGYCTVEQNQTISATSPNSLASCDVNQHAEGNSCVANPTGTSASCPPPQPPGVTAYQLWKGNTFNGYNICVLNSCGDPIANHIDKDSFVCVSNNRDCQPALIDPNNWTISSLQIWDNANSAWGPCHATQCTYNAQPTENASTPVVGDLTCQCGAANSQAREGVCTTCLGDYHYETLALPVGKDLTRDNCLAASGTWTGSACVTCTPNTGVDCSTKWCLPTSGGLTGCFGDNDCVAALGSDYVCKTGWCLKATDSALTRCQSNADCTISGYTCQAVDNRTLNWTGGLLTGSGSCAFNGCAAGYHEEPEASENCLPNSRACILGADTDPYQLTLTATQTWDATNNVWGPCTAVTCNSSATLTNGVCTCPSPKVIFDQGVCQLCGNGTVDAGETCDSGSSSRGFGVCTYVDETFGKVASCSLLPVDALPPKTVQAVFIVDTSGSIASPMANLCAVADTVQKNLVISGYNTTIDIYGIADSIGGNGVGASDGTCFSGLYTTKNDSQNVVQNIYWQYQYAGQTGQCDYTWTGNCSTRTTRADCGAQECKWDTSTTSCKPNYTTCSSITLGETCNNTMTAQLATNVVMCNWGGCTNIADIECSSYDSSNNCTSHAYCQWDTSSLSCSRNYAYCQGKTKTDCTTTPYNAKCQWDGKLVYGCGDGYVYSNNAYPTTYASGTLPNPVLLQTSTAFCPEDWVSSAITTIEKLSDSASPVQWTTETDRQLILLFDESPYNGLEGVSAGQYWRDDDFQHMKSSLRAATSGKSLIGVAQANKVKISIIFTAALTPTDANCTGWNWPTCGAITGQTACNNNVNCKWDAGLSSYLTAACTPNKDQNKYCALKNIVDSTGGTFQYGSTIMTTVTTTASTITNAISLAAVDKFCNATKVCSNDSTKGCSADTECGTGNTCTYSGVLDCTWR